MYNGKKKDIIFLNVDLSGVDHQQKIGQVGENEDE